MEIKGKVHCFFEQSGVFKNEFIKLGIPAYDYDIKNEFGQTDNVIDLFNEIKNAYDGKPSIYDNITPDDLIIAFFPCIKFCNVAEYNQKNKQFQMRRQGKPIKEIYKYLLKESEERHRMYTLALMMYGATEFNQLRLVMENPWHEQNYTNKYWFYPVSLIDKDRTRTGDFFKKPTGYWFVNCEPTDVFTEEFTPTNKIMRCGAGGGNTARKRRALKASGIITAKGSGQSGICSAERSLISPNYARNFICNHILGRKQNIGQLSLF